MGRLPGPVDLQHPPEIDFQDQKINRATVESEGLEFFLVITFFTETCAVLRLAVGERRLVCSRVFDETCRRVMMREDFVT